MKLHTDMRVNLLTFEHRVFIETCSHSIATVIRLSCKVSQFKRSVDLIAIRFVVGHDSLMNAAILLDS